MTDPEFETMTVRKLNEMGEHTDRKIKEVRKSMSDKQKYTKEIKLIKKNQIEIWEMKFSISETKTTTEGCNRTDLSLGTGLVT